MLLAIQFSDTVGENASGVSTQTEVVGSGLPRTSSFLRHRHGNRVSVPQRRHEYRRRHCS